MVPNTVIGKEMPHAEHCIGALSLSCPLTNSFIRAKEYLHHMTSCSEISVL